MTPRRAGVQRGHSAALRRRPSAAVCGPCGQCPPGSGVTFDWVLVSLFRLLCSQAHAPRREHVPPCGSYPNTMSNGKHMSSSASCMHCPSSHVMHEPQGML